MAIQAVGGIGAQSDGVNDLLSRAVMTGGAGTGPVGGNVMLDALYLNPVRHHMAVAAESPRRIIGEVVGTDCHCMGKDTVTGRLVGMAVKAAYLDPVQALLNDLSNRPCVQYNTGVVMTEGTVGTVQSVNVSSAFQGAVARLAKHRGIAGVADDTGRVYEPVVMRRSRHMLRGAVLMAGIAGDAGWHGTPPGSIESCRDKIRSIAIDATEMVGTAFIMT